MHVASSFALSSYIRYLIFEIIILFHCNFFLYYKFLLIPFFFFKFEKNYELTLRDVIYCYQNVERYDVCILSEL